jgi:acyl-CoA synthetase (NDP forming)
VSTGNEAMLAVDDLLSYLVADEQTRAIALFLESVRNPQRFKGVAAQALEADKPVVALKVGRSRAGGKVALAHTGAVVGDAMVTRAVLEDVGVAVVESLEDMLAAVGLASSTSRALGRRLGVVGVSGGACGLIADRATDEGIELPEFPATTISSLKEVLPAYATASNPLDVTGYVVVDPRISLQALEAVLRDASGVYDEVLFQLTLPRVAPPDPEPLLRRYEQVASVLGAAPVPVVLQSSSGSQLGGFADQVMERFGFFLLDGIEHGMAALGTVVGWHEGRARRLERLALAPAQTMPPPRGARGVWGETKARQLLIAGGVPVVPSVLVGDPGEAALGASSIGFPVALKLASDTLVHKSDLGAVALDLRTEQEVHEAAERLLASPVAQGVAGPCLSVAPMRTGGVELLVGVRRDPDWGPILALGLGGTWVEVLGDTTLLPLPVDASDVETMLNGLRAGPLLAGARGRAAVDRPSLIEAILAISRLGAGLGSALETLEVNPLWAGPEHSEALDALVVWN